MRQRDELIELCADICYYAQEHSNDEECWGPRGTSELHDRMEHTSFVIACFLAQNTKHGNDGVGWEIVVEDLAGPLLDHKQWSEKITALVDEFNE
jgi:hypothetical protein